MLRSVLREEVCRHIRGGAQLVDVLPARDYADEHLPGAINIPLKELNRQKAARLQTDRPVVVYCYDAQ
jgi:rhodanese-related sulfurtransferase